MMLIFVIIVFALYIISVISTYQNMFAFDKINRIVYLIIGFLIITIITVIISKTNLQIDNKELIKVIQRATQVIFIPLNALITLPVIANIISKYKIKSITEKNLTKKILIISILYIGFIIFERNYIKDFQTGVLSNIK